MTISRNLLFLLTILLTSPSFAAEPATQPVRNREGGPQFSTQSKIAKKFILVVDGSSATTKSMPLLSKEMEKCIDVTQADTMFDIVFFQDGKYTALSEQLLAATPENKKKGIAFIAAVKPKGIGDPRPALQFAMKLQPELIYLAVAGPIKDSTTLVKTIAEENAKARARIHTLMFLSKDASTEQALRDIALHNDGRFRLISEDDLGR